MAGSKNVDINDYFEYVDRVISNSKVSEADKKYHRNIVSLYKVTGIASSDLKDILCDISEKNPEVELYVLFEILSLRFFNLLNYWAWRKRVKFGII